MSRKELDVVDHMDMLDQIVEKHILKGNVDPSRIAKAMKITRGEAMGYLQEWRQIASNNYEIQARARELLTELDRGYNQAIKEWWNIVEDFDTPVHVKNASLKNLTDAQAKRHEILQKAGLYDDMDGIAELRESEEKAEAIKQLLLEVATKFPGAKPMILEGLGTIFKEPAASETVKVDVVNADV